MITRFFNASVGRSFHSFNIGRACVACSRHIRCVFTHKLRWKLFLDQIVEIGLLSQLVVVITGAFTGAVFAAQTSFI